MVGNIDIIHAVLYENEMILVVKFQNYHKIQTFSVMYHIFCCFRLPMCTFFNIWYDLNIKVHWKRSVIPIRVFFHENPKWATSNGQKNNVTPLPAWHHPFSCSEYLALSEKLYAILSSNIEHGSQNSYIWACPTQQVLSK